MNSLSAIPRTKSWLAGRRAGRKAGIKQPYVKKGKKAMVKLIKSVVKGQSETKTAMWYNVADVPGSATPGSYGASGWSQKNQAITSNAGDIKRLIPQIAAGTADNQRIGERISPKSLVVRGAVAINVALQSELPNNLYCVMYVLQHVTYKSYASVFASNDFTQLLNTGENSTVAFEGKQIQKDLPVDKAYYRLLKKKVIPLRRAGIDNTTGSNSYVVSMANSHRYHANFSLNLSKQLPKVLKFPEGNATNPNDPTNSSIFLCCGYYAMNDSSNTIIPLDANTALNLTYVSQLNYKDL